MLYDKLTGYAGSGVYPMHMPGHKRNTELLPPGLPYGIDITEIHGFDDLRDPRGVLRETGELAAGLYGSDKAFLLVNGSTVGNLAAIGAFATTGRKVIIDDNSHYSVSNAVGLFGQETVKVKTRIDGATGISCGVDPNDVKSTLEGDPDIKLVVITSPTYEGVISDVGSIADIARGHGAALHVDSAHGAHLGFSAAFHSNAIRSGADSAVMSLHKTLPALTQCSLLHIRGNRVRQDETARMLSILQTSSPSYVLMASIDRCLRILSLDRDMLFSRYERNLAGFSSAMKQLKRLFVINNGNYENNTRFYAFDPGKLVIVTKNTKLSGFTLAEILRTEYSIELEMARPCYAVAMTSICDSEDGFSRLAGALVEIDRSL